MGRARGGRGRGGVPPNRRGLVSRPILASRAPQPDSADQQDRRGNGAERDPADQWRARLLRPRFLVPILASAPSARASRLLDFALVSLVVLPRPFGRRGLSFPRAGRGLDGLAFTILLRGRRSTRAYSSSRMLPANWERARCTGSSSKF